MTAEGKNVLICGHRSFAAKGLSALLNQAGYLVTQFSRGAVSVNGNTVEGAVDEIHTNPHLANSFDTVINYILLKDRSVQDNERYLGSLLKLCEEKQVKHLIHISSISVYKSNVKLINEKEKAFAQNNA